MVIIRPEWWDWASYDDEGQNGLREDAPPEMKAAYERDMKAEEEFRERGREARKASVERELNNKH